MTIRNVWLQRKNGRKAIVKVSAELWDNERDRIIAALPKGVEVDAVSTELYFVSNCVALVLKGPMIPVSQEWEKLPEYIAVCHIEDEGLVIDLLPKGTR